MIERVIGNAKLYNCDCLDLLRTLPDGAVDCIITDPPYDAEAHTPMQRTRAVIEGRQEMAGMPFAPLTENLRALFIGEALRVCRGWVVVFCQTEAVGAYQQLTGDAWRRSMVWVKPDGPPCFMGDRPAMGYESIALVWAGHGKSRWNGGGKRGVFTYNSTNYVHLNVAQKPIGLIRELVALFTNPGDIVLDPFAGSFTTGVACRELGRRFIGCEVDAEQFAVGTNRIATAQPMLPEMQRVEAEQRTLGV